jgi:HEAT repeat protein
MIARLQFGIVVATVLAFGPVGCVQEKPADKSVSPATKVDESAAEAETEAFRKMTGAEQQKLLQEAASGTGRGKALSGRQVARLLCETYEDNDKIHGGDSFAVPPEEYHRWLGQAEQIARKYPGEARGAVAGRYSCASQEELPRILGEIGGPDNIKFLCEQAEKSPSLGVVAGLERAGGPEALAALRKLAEGECLEGNENVAARDALGRLIAPPAMQPDAEAATLIGSLKSDQVEVRRAAAYKLSQRDSLPAKFIPDLLKACGDEDYSVRSPLGQALDKAEKADGITPVVMNLVRASKVGTRLAAAKKLSQCDSVPAKHLPDLLNAINHEDLGGDSDQDVCPYLVTALGKIDKPDEVIPALVDIAGQHKSREARSGAVTALAKYAKESNAARAAIIKGADDQAEEVRWAVAVGLVHIQPADAGTIAALTRLLTDPDESVRGATADQLARIGPGAKWAVEPLIKATKDKAARVAGAAMFALGQIGVADAKVVSALSENLKDERGSIKYIAAMTLEQLGPPAKDAAGELEKVFADKRAFPARFGNDVRSEPDPDKVANTARWAAAAALGKMGMASKVVPGLIEDLKDNQGWARLFAAKALGRIGPAAQDAVPALIAALTAKHPKLESESGATIREESARSLGLIGAGAGTAKPALQDLLKDQSLSPHERQVIEGSLRLISTAPTTRSAANPAPPATQPGATGKP